VGAHAHRCPQALLRAGYPHACAHCPTTHLQRTARAGLRKDGTSTKRRVALVVRPLEWTWMLGVAFCCNSLADGAGDAQIRSGQAPQRELWRSHDYAGCRRFSAAGRRAQHEK